MSKAVTPSHSDMRSIWTLFLVRAKRRFGHHAAQTLTWKDHGFSCINQLISIMNPTSKPPPHTQLVLTWPLACMELDISSLRLVTIMIPITGIRYRRIRQRVV